MVNSYRVVDSASNANSRSKARSRSSLLLPSPSLGLLPSLLLLLLALLTATNHDDSARWQLLVAAQNDSPFKGQGIAPTLEVDADGKLVGKQGNESQVPVYMSIMFDKLEDVDGEDCYTMGCRLNRDRYSCSFPVCYSSGSVFRQSSFLSSAGTSIGGVI